MPKCDTNRPIFIYHYPMKQILRFTAMLTGGVTVLAGLSSCDKDKDNSNECCTVSYTEDDATYSYELCEDGSFVYSYTYDGKTETYSLNWKEEYDYTWAEAKEMFLDEWGDYGARCN